MKVFPLQLMAEYHERVWGGQRLRPSTPPIGEAWIVYENDRVAAGEWAGRTLAEVAEKQGEALLGQRVVRATGTRFPLLIKLLDCRDWLSIQVHPDDEKAVQLEGPGHFGKTEAWHILEADEGARLIAGVRAEATPEDVAAAIRSGSILDWVQYHSVYAGDTVYMPAGTLHALGPGLLLYEVQQTSDITYRVFDWNRPASEGRALHVEQSVAVTKLGGNGKPHRPARLPADGEQRLLSCPYFALDLLCAEERAQALNTRGESFHALTVIEGQAEVAAGGEVLRLGRYESALVPAAAGKYALRPLGTCKVLKACVE